MTPWMMSVLGRPKTVWIELLNTFDLSTLANSRYIKLEFRTCSRPCLPGDRLEAVKLPESLMEIGSGAFRGCKSLKRMVIPESVTVIEAETFYGCEALREVGWVQKKGETHLPNVGKKGNGCSS